MASSDTPGMMNLEWGSVKIAWNPQLELCHLSTSDTSVMVQRTGHIITIIEKGYLTQIGLENNGFSIADFYPKQQEEAEHAQANPTVNIKAEGEIEETEEPIAKRQRIWIEEFERAKSSLGQLLEEIRCMNLRMDHKIATVLQDIAQFAAVSAEGKSDLARDAENRKRKVPRRDNPDPEEIEPESTEQTEDPLDEILSLPDDEIDFSVIHY